MSSEAIQLVALVAAFWVAVLGYLGRDPTREFGARFGIGLAAGGVLAHAGWALLHADRVWRQPDVLLQPGGMSVLFVPYGLLAVTPWSADRATRARFGAAAFGSLPLALLTARLGCVAAGCCHGVPTGLPWAVLHADSGVGVHPTAVYDAIGLLVLWTLVRALPVRWTPAAVLVGIGLLRIAIDPLRADPPLGAPVVPVFLPAAACVLAGVAWVLPPRGLSAVTTSASAWRRDGKADDDWLEWLAIAWTGALVAGSAWISWVDPAHGMLATAIVGAYAVTRRFGWRFALRAGLVIAASGTLLEVLGLAEGAFRHRMSGALYFWVPLGWFALGMAAVLPAASAWPASPGRRFLGGALWLVAIALVYDPVGLSAGYFTWPGGGPYVSGVAGFDGSQGIPLVAIAGWALVGGLAGAIAGAGAAREAADRALLLPIVLVVAYGTHALLLGLLEAAIASTCALSLAVWCSRRPRHDETLPLGTQPRPQRS